MQAPKCRDCKSKTEISTCYVGGIYVWRCANDHKTQTVDPAAAAAFAIASGDAEEFPDMPRLGVG